MDKTGKIKIAMLVVLTGLPILFSIFVFAQNGGPAVSNFIFTAAPEISDVSLSQDAITIQTNKGNIYMKIVDKDENSVQNVPQASIDEIKDNTYEINYDDVNKDDYKYEITADFPLKKTRDYIIENEDGTLRINLYDLDFSKKWDRRFENETDLKWVEEEDEKLYSRLGTITSTSYKITIALGDETCSSLLNYATTNGLGHECDGGNVLPGHDYETCVALNNSVGLEIQNASFTMDNCALLLNTTTDEDIYFRMKGNLTMEDDSYIGRGGSGYFDFDAWDDGYRTPSIYINDSTLSGAFEGYWIEETVGDFYMNDVTFKNNKYKDLYISKSGVKITNTKFYENKWDEDEKGMNIYAGLNPFVKTSLDLENIDLAGDVYEYWVYASYLDDSYWENVKSMTGPSSYRSSETYGFYFLDPKNNTFEDVWVGDVYGGAAFTLQSCYYGTFGNPAITPDRKNKLINVYGAGGEEGLLIANCPYTYVYGFSTYGAYWGYGDNAVSVTGIGSYGENVTITDSYFRMRGNDGERAADPISADNVVFQDVIFQSGNEGQQDIRVQGGSTTCISCEFSKSTHALLDVGANYTQKWYLTAKAKDSLDNWLEDVNITAWDKDGNLRFSELTDMDGEISTHILPEIFKYKNSTGQYEITYYPYTLNATKTSYEDASEQVNLTQDVTVTFELSEVPANESQAREAIESGIDDALDDYTVYTDQKVHIRTLNNTQQTGSFDKVAVSNNQTWVFNYVTSGESFLNMLNITPVFYVWEAENIGQNQIESHVESFINTTIL